MTDRPDAAKVTMPHPDMIIGVDYARGPDTLAIQLKDGRIYRDDEARIWLMAAAIACGLEAMLAAAKERDQ